MNQDCQPAGTAGQYCRFVSPPVQQMRLVRCSRQSCGLVKRGREHGRQGVEHDIAVDRSTTSRARATDTTSAPE
jgi:hypothetical protein